MIELDNVLSFKNRTLSWFSVGAIQCGECVSTTISNYSRNGFFSINNHFSSPKFRGGKKFKKINPG